MKLRSEILNGLYELVDGKLRDGEKGYNSLLYLQCSTLSNQRDRLSLKSDE